MIPGADGGEFRAQADFDGDGNLDLLHFEGVPSIASGYRVFLGDGNGRFTILPAVSFDFPQPFDVELLEPYIGDFDGNGELDFALLRDTPGTSPADGVEFFLGDGTGTFPIRAFSALADPQDAAVGNQDADSADELAVRNGVVGGQRALRWFEFTTGSIVPTSSLPLGVPGVSLAFDLAALDVNGDGLDDIAATGTLTTGVGDLIERPSGIGRNL